MLTMEGPRTSGRALLWSAVWILCLTSTISSLSATTSGQTSHSSVSEETCNVTLPNDAGHKLLNTISTAELRQFLSQPNVIRNGSNVCAIVRNYNKTSAFLQTEDVPDDVKKQVLPCVWPLALSSNNSSEADIWFNQWISNYLRFLSRSLISSNEVQNSSCFAFQKLVLIMGNNFTYNGSDFGKDDVYNTIRTYLSTGSGARCYNASDPELNSTAWFVNNIGSFVTFMTLDDLTSFVSTSQIQGFLVNQANLELFNNTAIPENVTNFYLTELYEFNPTFNPLRLPGFFLCSSEVPSTAYSSLSESDTLLILNELKRFCNGTEDPEVSAALASNIQTITPQTFANLGNASSGLTSSQITSLGPSVLVSSLATLSTISTWNPEQSSAIIRAMMTSGFQINSSSSLKSLGTLVAGVPSQSIERIPASELLSMAQDSTVVTHMLAAPTVVQQTFVSQIITVDTSPASVVANVPDAMATEIPPALLEFPGGTVNMSAINRKQWTSNQAAMFFGVLGENNFDAEQLSNSVLQGFTCTSVGKMSRRRIRQLIRACRPRRGRAKVKLKESQLTCMYNLLRGDLTQNFTEYPSDLLLYFSSADVQKANCRSYFSSLGAADFTVASSVLNKGALLFSEARSCLGISGVSLSRDNVEVLGNMACVLDGSYIQNADPLILEKLKACKDFSDSQVVAMERLLLSGNTQYRNVTTWDKQTLEDLGVLPLYFTGDFWSQFSTKSRKRFLKGFMPQLRRNRTLKRKLFKQISSSRPKRGAGCTVGNITQLTISEGSFPFGYDVTQFDLCLDLPVLRENLYSICEKVDDDNFQKVILRKLNEVFPSGVSDENVQVLGSVSRAASLADIFKWDITDLDNLAVLMENGDGLWEAAKSKAIITKYLKTSGNSLGSTELNSINSNICSLDTSTLRNITTDSIRNAKCSCSSEQKQVLYEIANKSFSSQRTSPNAFYNLIQPFIGGAPVADVLVLSTQNISMDVATFQTLNSRVIAALTVANVKDLMGNQLQDLKTFENVTTVRSWINMQTWEDLNTLGLDLSTNRTSTTQAMLISNSTDSSVTASVTQANNTTSGADLGKHSTSVFMLALLTAILQPLL